LEIHIVVRLLGILSETANTWQLEPQQIILPVELNALEETLLAAPLCSSACVQMTWQLQNAARC